MTRETMHLPSTVEEIRPESPQPRRVLVLFESSDSGAAAIRRAADVAEATGATLEVVSLAGQDPINRCGPSPHAYNCAVREAANEGLLEARKLLGARAERATFRVLVGEPEPPLTTWVADRGFDVVFIPRHRLARGGHWAARKLRRSTATEVQLVG